MCELLAERWVEGWMERSGDNWMEGWIEGQMKR